MIRAPNNGTSSYPANEYPVLLQHNPMAQRLTPSLLAPAVIRAPVKGAIYPPGNENRGCVAERADAPEHVAAVTMITFNRPSYLRKSVHSLLRVHRKDPSFK